MALPAVQALRAALPDARIVGMARPAHVELATRIRGLNDVLAAAPRTGGGRFRASWVAFTGLRRARFDAAVVMAPSFEAALTIWLAGIPIRVGHETDHRSALLNRVVGVRETHRADGFLDLVREFGIEEQAEPAALELSELDRRFADEFFNGVGVDREARPIFVNPAAAKRPRAWSSDRFRELSDAVASAHPDVPVIVHDHPPFEAPRRLADIPADSRVVRGKSQSGRACCRHRKMLSLCWQRQRTDAPRGRSRCPDGWDLRLVEYPANFATWRERSGTHRGVGGIRVLTMPRAVL